MSIDGQDRRAAGATRVPFEGVVEVGAALGPAFEATAIDVSEDGMHLRTAYLPEVGQPLTCRFDLGKHDSVLASGEVVWRQEANRGGEFGIRFTDLDGESATAISRIVGSGHLPAVPRAPGSKVRLHIEGLGSPMRARIKSDSHAELMVGSELGFLQVGKQLELEDAETGEKRPARIDRVEVEIHPESQVPQLVVALRYDDEIPCDAEEPREVTPDPTVMDQDEDREDTDGAMAAPAHRMDGADEEGADDGFEDEEDPDAAEMAELRNTSDKVKSALARGAAKVTPALEQMLGRAKTTVALLAAKRAAAKANRAAVESAPPRRTTAPPPGGGLHAAGRKVVRGDSMHDARKEADQAFTPKKPSRRKIALGAAAGAALLLGAIAMRKPAAPPPTAATQANDTTAAAAAPGTPGAATPTGLPDPATNVTQNTVPGAMPPGVNAPGTPGAGAPTPFAANAPPSFGATAQGGPSVSDAPPIVNDGEEDDTPAPSRRRNVNVTPFSNGPVAHGNVLRLKMDGAIERIEGATQPLGFTVEIPNRRSLEAASPLADKDSRIAAIKVENEGHGAELSVSFKDGVPNYLVRAKGDVLEIVLAPNRRIGPRSAPQASPNVVITPAKATGGLKRHHRRH